MKAFVISFLVGFTILVLVVSGLYFLVTGVREENVAARARTGCDSGYVPFESSLGPACIRGYLKDRRQ